MSRDVREMMASSGCFQTVMCVWVYIKSLRCLIVHTHKKTSNTSLLNGAVIDMRELISYLKKTDN